MRPSRNDNIALQRAGHTNGILYEFAYMFTSDVAFQDAMRLVFDDFHAVEEPIVCSKL